MQATLPTGAKPPGLRAGVQQAIAVAADDSATAVELELLSILDGPAFRGSPRSRVFLQFVVEQTLAGRQDSLKERTVGIAVLGKRTDYDTGADSGVRVRANDVRKRLAAHYEAVAPRAGLRIELPAGAYAPRFVPAPTPLASPALRNDQPAPMLLWQLAAPTLFAAFLALMAIRGGVESSDAFSRFWNQAMAGRTEIAIAVDAGQGTSISPAMADAAMPFEALAGALQAPVHIVAAGSKTASTKYCVIRLSLTERPPGRAAFLLNGVSVFRGQDGGGSGRPAIWLWAENVEKLRSAAMSLSTRSGFPEIR
ncbi:MAG: hypothetical protein ABSG03_06300 [Bryobacteraceae bacterium]|jgi:hypothetical protein